MVSLPPFAEGSVDGGRNERFDGQVAHEILSSGSSASPALATELLSVLATETTQHSAAGGLMKQTLPEFQSRLRSQTAFMTFLDAGARGAILWITHDQARIVPTLAPEELRRRISILTESVSNSSSRLHDIRTNTKKVSTRLLNAFVADQQPETLLIDADSELSAIPWPILRWPGSDAELIEHTTSTLVRPYVHCCSVDDSRARKVFVFVGAQYGASHAGLSFLPSASTEASVIASAISGSNWSLIARQADDPDDILAALSRRGDWVHIAAHGSARPERIGYSGLWLTPSTATEPPRFLSGIDILNNGVSNDLVVLDACQLALGANDMVRLNSSFADFVSKAGARQVVAARWPISDNAAAIWTSAFYGQAADQNSSDVSVSLRAAQMRLRTSRNFSHPFFWASWVQMKWLDGLN